MWNIYGKQYDLTKFAKYHPGGEEIINKTKNERDITALFETYHAFSSIDKITDLLNKYEINKNELKEDYKYDFTNYRKLIEKIKKVLPDRNSIKADLYFYVMNIIVFILYIITFLNAMFSSYSIFVKVILSCISGIAYVSLGFNIMHNASHFSISTNIQLNNILSKIWNSWALWNDKIWFYHHVYNHHSFTGIENNDPDLYHLLPFGDKIGNSKKIPSYLWLKKTQHLIMPYVLFLLPGQYFGQSISYFLTIIKPKIFKIKIPSINYYDQFDIMLILLNIYCLYHGFPFSSIFYIISLNFWYSINIGPDHDTFETSIENHYTGTDWCKMQICNSNNFINDNVIWTHLFGGINYQIEHHLFPNMNHIHYPIIAPIVEQYCQENNIPYSYKNTVYEAYNSFLKMLEYRSKQI